MVDGEVSSIGVLATSGSTTTTYPVTISLDSADLGGLSGADANVAIIVQRSVDVTTVPSSAVRTVGDHHLVTVVGRQHAEVGAGDPGHGGRRPHPGEVGRDLGRAVLVADLNEPLPSTSTATTVPGSAVWAVESAAVASAARRIRWLQRRFGG